MYKLPNKEIEYEKRKQINVLSETNDRKLCNVYDMNGNVVTPTEKDKRKATKKKGKTEVDPFWNLEDIKKISDRFIEKKQYKYYLVFMIGLCMGRRIGDTLKLKYCHFFEENGTWRKELCIQEEKTDKFSTILISGAVINSMEKFFELEGINPMEHYNEDIFVFSKKDTNRRDAAYRTALKKVAEEVGIKYSVSTHSTRKAFGYWSQKIHPNDVNSLDILQSVFRHSNKSTTMNYVGITKERVQNYFNDIGELFSKAAIGETYKINNTPVVSLQTNDLRDLLNIAYQEGIKNANGDATDHVNFVNEMMEIVEEMMIK